MKNNEINSCPINPKSSRFSTRSLNAMSQYSLDMEILFKEGFRKKMASGINTLKNTKDFFSDKTSRSTGMFKQELCAHL